MSTQTLSSVAIEIVGQYHQAGQYLARAYDRGVQRAADAISERYAEFVNARELPLVDDGVRSSLIEAQQRVSGIVVGALRAGNERMAAVNNRIAEGVKGGIGALAGRAQRIGAAYNSEAADTLALLGVPSAQLSLSVAKAIADGAKRIGDTAGDAIVEAVEAKPATKRAARRRA
jgi:hypothetical protein